jgi:hypothetical protein
MYCPRVCIGLKLSYEVKEYSQHTIGVEFSSRTLRLGEKRIKLQVCTQSPHRRHCLQQLLSALGHSGPGTIQVGGFLTRTLSMFLQSVGL